MHTGIILAIEADDADEAVSCVESFIENNANWSDWNEIGGRWSSVIEGNVLCYKDDPEEFNRIVDSFIESTNREEIELIKEVGHLSVEELVSDPRYNFDLFMSDEAREAEQEELKSLSDEEKRKRSLEKFYCWRAIKLLRMNNGEFVPETHFFDAEWNTRTRNELDKRIAANPEKQYLVVWDFHF